MLKRIKHIFAKRANDNEKLAKKPYKPNECDRQHDKQLRDLTRELEEQSKEQPKLFNIEVHNDEIEEFEAIHYTVYRTQIQMELEGDKIIILPYKKLFIEEITQPESENKPISKTQ
jgi:hypothetical protein